MGTIDYSCRGRSKVLATDSIALLRTRQGLTETSKFVAQALHSREPLGVSFKSAGMLAALVTCPIDVVKLLA